MKWKIWLAGITIIAGLATATTWTKVGQKHKGCENRLSRCERLYDKFSTSIRRLETLRSLSPSKSKTRIENFLNPLYSKKDYLHNRIDRVKRMSAKISEDISVESSKKGGCPNCIVSSVELLCRQVESLVSELNEQCANLREFENSIKRNRNVSHIMKQNRKKLTELKKKFSKQKIDNKQLKTASIKQRQAANALKRNERHKAFSLSLAVADIIRNIESGINSSLSDTDIEQQIDKAQKLCKKTNNKTAGAVLDKAVEHYNYYKNLTKQEKHEKALKEKAVAKELVEQAIDIMSEKQ